MFDADEDPAGESFPRASGQAPLVPQGDLAPVVELENRISRREFDRSAAHAEVLRDVLELHRLNEAVGLGLSTAAQLALLQSCSEARAGGLLEQAGLFDLLPDGLAVLDEGRLTVEQAATVSRCFAGLVRPDAELVWARLLAQLAADHTQGVVRPPKRLEELIRRLIAELLPEQDVERRRSGEQDADVTYDRRQDGLVDLHAFGITAPNAQAALSNIAFRAQPAGDWDERTAGQRRRDAVVDLLTGRDPLLGCSCGADDPDVTAAGRGIGTTCGCPKGASVPCGAQVQVLVPLATALGLSDVPAELVGHGAIDRDLLTQLLLSAPQLQAVFVDDNGVPVAISDQMHVPDRRDPESVRNALLRLLLAPPGEIFPRHPTDHPPEPEPVGESDLDDDAPDRERPDDDPGDGPFGGSGPPPGGSPRGSPPAAHPDHDHERLDERVLANAALGRALDTPITAPAASSAPAVGAHPAGRSGPYSIRPRLRTFLHVRSLHCEWPGCGARAVRCDLDHDLAWPDGPTCACNLGPLCRRHHRLKQTGWHKQRLTDGTVRWTSPTGRSYLNPTTHPAPPTPVRPLPPLPADDRDPYACLSPNARQDEEQLDDPGNPRWDALLTDPAWLTIDPDLDPHENLDLTGDAIRSGDSRWTLDLHDPYRWTDLPDPAPALH